MKPTLTLVVAALLAAAGPARAADEPQKLTIDPSAWLFLNTYSSSGALNANDLPRFAKAGATDEQAAGFGVRQTRLRVNVAGPSAGLLGDATLKGLVEADFMGGNAVGSDDPSMPLIRLRHAYVSATWARLANLSVLVGQTWGLLEGPYFAQSLSHVAVPRFAGAGFLYRRAPQVRVSGGAGSTFGFTYAAAALAPMDRVGVTAAPTAAAPGPVGERAAVPNAEARIAGVYRLDGKPLAEVGFSGHYGQEKYTFAATTTPTALAAKDVLVDSQALALDAKLDLPYVQLVGGVYQGQNLDVWNSVAPGTVVDSSARTVKDVKTRGYWAQAAVTPVLGYTFLLGVGQENPDDSTLPAAIAATPTAAATTYILRNTQYSTGAIVNLTSRWRIGLEFTRYVTTNSIPTGADTYTGNQVELSTQLSL